MVKLRGKNGTFVENKDRNKKIELWILTNKDKHFCQCGCGTILKIERKHYLYGLPRFVHGHNSIANREEISKQLKDYYKTKEGKQKTKEHQEFMKKYFETHDGSMKGRKLPRDVVEKHAKLLKEKYDNGELVIWNKGKTAVYSKETLKLMALAKLGKTGELACNWQGGKSFEPYPSEFNETLKQKIRKRDNYTCQICGVLQTDCIRKLSTHHIDYNKENCNESNLISLCRKCHMETNSDREYWSIILAEKVVQNG